MKISLLIAAGLVSLAVVLPSVRRVQEGESQALSLPGKAAVRERVIPTPRVAGQDPRQAVEELLALTEGEARRAELDLAIGRWIERNPREVLDWLDSCGRAGLDGVRTAALAALAWESSAEAANWLVDHPDHAGFDNLAAVLAPWCEISPAECHAWVRENLETDMRDALRPVMLATCRDAGVSAVLLDEGVGDEVLVNLARGSIHREPGFAKVLIERVKSSELRESAGARLFRRGDEAVREDLVQDAGEEHQED